MGCGNSAVELVDAGAEDPSPTCAAGDLRCFDDLPVGAECWRWSFLLPAADRALNPAGRPGLVALNDAGTKVCGEHPDFDTAADIAGRYPGEVDGPHGGGYIEWYGPEALAGCMAPDPESTAQSVCAPSEAQKKAGSSFENAMWDKAESQHGDRAYPHWSYHVPANFDPPFATGNGNEEFEPKARAYRIADWAVKAGAYAIHMHEAKCYSARSRQERAAWLVVSQGKDPTKAALEALMLEAAFFWQLADYVMKAQTVTRAISASNGVIDIGDPEIVDGPREFWGMPVFITYHFCRLPPAWAEAYIGAHHASSVIDYHWRGERASIVDPPGPIAGADCKACYADDSVPDPVEAPGSAPPPNRSTISNCDAFPEDVCADDSDGFIFDTPVCDFDAGALIGGEGMPPCWDTSDEYHDLEAPVDVPAIVAQCAGLYYDLCKGSE